MTRNRVVLSLLFFLSVGAWAQTNPVPFGFFGMSSDSESLTGDYPLNTLCQVSGYVCPSTGTIGTLGHTDNFQWAYIEECSPANTDDSGPCYKYPIGTGSSTWTGLDNAVQAALAKGVPVVITLGLTPSWAINTRYQGSSTYCKNARGTLDQCYMPPDDIDNPGGSQIWTTFVQTLLARYGPSSAYASVKKYYEPWNEASNLTGSWYLAKCTATAPCTFYSHYNPNGVQVTDRGASRLAILAQILYTQAKTGGTTSTGKIIADPNAIISTPSVAGPRSGTNTNTAIPDWLTNYYLPAVHALGCSPSPICADTVSYHGYLNPSNQRPWPEGQAVSATTGTWGPATGQLSDVRAAVTVYDTSNPLPILNTEGGWGKGDLTSNTVSPCNNASICDAAWLARYYILLAGQYAPVNGGGQGLQLASWYQWENAGGSNPWGTIKAGSTNSSPPTAAGVAYGWVSKWLNGNSVSPAAPATNPGPAFWQADIGWGGNPAAGAIIWYCGDTGAPPNCEWDTTVTQTYAVDTTQYDHYQDLAGHPQSISNPLSIGMSPVILFKGTSPPWLLNPGVTWAQPAGITYNTALGSSQINATASVPGTFVYTPPSGTVLSAGAGQTLSVLFTPNDTNNYAPTTVTTTIDVAKAPPVLTWAQPAQITYGSALGSGQLDATANVPGTFTYTPPAGTVLPAGNGQALSVTFTPTESTVYTQASAATTIDVAPATGVTGPNLIVTKTMTRDGSGQVVVTLTIANSGGTAGQNVMLTAVKIGTTAGTPLPQSLGAINAGSSLQTTVIFPSSIGVSGAASVLTVSGSFTGGTFSSSSRITLP